MRNLDKIKALAVAKKLRLQDVADSAGITYQQLNRIIRGGSTSIDTLERIAGKLGVPASFFLDGSGDVISIGDNSPGAGKENNFNTDLSEVLLRAFDEISAQRRLAESALAKVDELIKIIKSKN